MKNSFIKEFIKLLKENEDNSNYQTSNDDIVAFFNNLLEANGKYWLSASKGEYKDILAYQNFLSDLGYPVDVDGIYGPQTINATKELQKDIDADYENYTDSKFKIDGSFGLSTLKMLVAALYSGGNLLPSITDFKKAFPNAKTDISIVRYLYKNKENILNQKRPGTIKKIKDVIKSKTDAVSSIGSPKGVIDSTQYKVLPDPDSGKAMGKKYPKIPRPEFIKKFGPMAIKSVKGTGIFPSTVLAQAALESGWATSRLGDNGLFGVKGATRKNGKSIPHKPNDVWSGKVGLFKTKEKVGSKTIRVKRYFRIYDSIEDSFKDHVNVLLKPRYSNAMAATDPGDQVMEIGSAGYAAKGEKGNTYGPYLRDKMLPGIIKEMEKQGIPNNKGGIIMSENVRKKVKNSYIKEFIKILKENEETTFGDVSSEDSLKRRAGKTVLSGKIRDKNIVDLLIKISKGGFWISKSKASKDEIAAYQKFLSGLGYVVDIDGIFGSQTKEATKELQSDLFVDKIDGFFGKSTLNSLAGSLEENNIQPNITSFKKAFPDVTLGDEIISWLINFSQNNEREKRWDDMFSSEDAYNPNKTKEKGDFIKGPYSKDPDKVLTPNENASVLDHLDPIAIPIFKKEFFEKWFDAGYNVRITSGYRTIAKQRELQGKPASQKLGSAEAGYSPHQWGLAVDINVSFKDENGKNVSLTAKTPNSVWLKHIKRAGIDIENKFQWGGFFRKRDSVHFDLYPMLGVGKGSKNTSGRGKFASKLRKQAGPEDVKYSNLVSENKNLTKILKNILFKSKSFKN